MSQGPSKIMIIRHGEKPAQYCGKTYQGVDVTAKKSGLDGAEDLVTIGWQRAGALVTLFAPPRGPVHGLATPDFLYASDPSSTKPGHSPSQRPFETIVPLAAALGTRCKPMSINSSFKRDDYGGLVKDVLTRTGTVLISWQHEAVPLMNGDKPPIPGISQHILDATGSSNTFGIPSTWPKDRDGEDRYDLIWVFERSTSSGKITGFQILPQFLLAGDSPYPL